jgi:hypothetical protein
LTPGRTLVQVRERSFLDVLDLSLIVIRERPLTLGLAALAGVAPFAALNAWLLRDPNFPDLFLIYLFILEIPWATAPLTVVLGGLMFGRAPSAWTVFKTIARALIPMAFYQLVIRGFLLVSVVLFPIVPTRLAFVDQVLLLERGRWWKVVQRSAELCESRSGSRFAEWLGQMLFGVIFVIGFWAGTGAIVQVLISSEMTWQPTLASVLDVRLHLAIWLTIVFFGVARFFTYIDQRIRLEGWEVKLRLRGVARALEDSRKW